MTRFRLSLTMAAVAAACSGGGESRAAPGNTGPRPEVLPVMLNREVPFRYPSALYSHKVQGNVVLRIYIDSAGRVAPDSTRVVETSGYTALDSSAVRGSAELRFVPAKRRGQSMPVWILFPVHFRHPDAPPLPGDSVPAGRSQ